MNPPSQKQIRTVALASLLGATIEWYDFFLYGVVAGIVFNKLYFPTDDPFIGTLLAYSTFAIGYLARPFGAFVFGHFGDKIGRKSMLVLTMLIMGIATIGIGLVPTYAQIGIAAPIILQTFRLMQGLGLGGEWGGSVLMTYEYASKRQRAFYASIPQMGLATGLCLSSGVVALLSASLTDQQFLEWGWRIAFLISVVLVGVALYIRLHILETPDFQKAKDSGKTADKTLPIVKVCRNHPGNIALGVGARWIDGVFFNVLAVFVISYLVQYISIERTQALTIVMIAALLMCPSSSSPAAWPTATAAAWSTVCPACSAACPSSPRSGSWKAAAAASSSSPWPSSSPSACSTPVSSALKPPCSPTCSRRTCVTPASPSSTSSPASWWPASCPACAPSSSTGTKATPCTSASSPCSRP